MWHYRFEIDGEKYFGPTCLEATERNRRAALLVEAKERERVLNGEPRPLKVEARLFSDAAAEFLKFAKGHFKAVNTYLRTRTSFTSLTRFFGDQSVRSVTPGRVQDYVAWRREHLGEKRDRGVKDITIRHDLHALSKGFQYFIKHNWARVNPVEADDIPSDAEAVRMYILTPEEEKLYFPEAWPHAALHDVGKIMIHQGCRPDEVLSLQKPDIDLAKGAFTIRKGKSKAARRTREIFARRLQRAEGPWLFPGETPDRRLAQLNPPHNRVLNRLAMCRCLHRRKEHNQGRYHRACKCGCQEFREESRVDFVIYDLRHTFATRMAERGMNLQDLQAILGHSDIRMVMKYVHVSQRAMDRAMEEYGTPKTAATEAGKERVQ